MFMKFECGCIGIMMNHGMGGNEVIYRLNDCRVGDWQAREATDSLSCKKREAMTPKEIMEVLDSLNPLLQGGYKLEELTFALKSAMNVWPQP